jgi:hypothetical protein
MLNIMVYVLKDFKIILLIIVCMLRYSYIIQNLEKDTLKRI